MNVGVSTSTRGVLLSWAAYGIGPLLAIASAPLLARALGPDGRGQLAAVLQPMTVADAFAAAGLPAAMTYFVARNYDLRRVLRAARWIYVTIGTMVAGALLSWAVYLDSQGIVPLYMTVVPWCLVVPFGAYVAVRRGVWQGYGQYRPLDIERMASPAVRTVGVIALFAVGISLVAPYLAIYVGASLVAACALFRPFPHRTNASVPLRSPNLREVEVFSLKASIGTVAIALNNRLDQAVLPALISLGDLGAYSVAVAVAEIPTIFSAILARNLLSESARRSSRANMTRTILLSGGALVTASAVIAASAPYLIPLAFGKNFTHAVSPVIVLTLATVVGVVGIISTAVLTGRGQPTAASLPHALGAVLTLVAYLVVGRDVTLLGACWISVGVQLCVGVAGTFLLLRKPGVGRVGSISR